MCAIVKRPPTCGASAPQNKQESHVASRTSVSQKQEFHLLQFSAGSSHTLHGIQASPGVEMTLATFHLNLLTDAEPSLKASQVTGPTCTLPMTETQLSNYSTRATFHSISIKNILSLTDSVQGMVLGTKGGMRSYKKTLVPRPKI